jgi:hypothetical protein
MLVVIHDLHVKSITVPPNETHAILIVDSNAVLPSTIATKPLQAIPGRHPQVIELEGSIQNGEFLERPSMQISR